MTSDTGIWAAAAQAADAALLISDSDGLIVEANQATLNIFGLDANAIKGRRVEDLTAGKPDLECLIQPFEQGGKSWQSISLRDATVSRRAADNLVVKSKMESLGELAGNMAHEFNNHLGGASGFAQMALMKADDPDRVRMCLEEVIAATDAGARQTAQIMVFGRRQLQEPEAITVGPHVADSKGLITSLITSEIELIVTVEDEISKALLEPGQLTEAVLELCENAVNAMSGMEGGRLEVKLVHRDMSAADLRIFYDALPGPYLCLSISDTGAGMTEDTRRSMFDPFFTTQDIGEGRGLGLSVVYSVFSRFGGMMDVTSKPGEGTTVTVLLPVVE